MSCAAGPDIKEDGLVLALDGGNNKSHSSNRFISYGSGLITQDISFQVNGNGTFQRVAAGTVIGGYVVKTTDVVYSYALGSNGCHYHGNSAPIPTGSYATFSFDYLVTGATTYPITDYLANFENYGGGALGGSVATANSLQNVWQRRTFTSGPTASAGTQAMFLYPGSCGGRLADSGTIYFRNPKVEWTNVDTGDGNFSSMPNVTTWYDMSGNGNNGTLTNTPYYIMGSNNINNYISFDGVDDYITTANTTISGSQTFSVWAMVTGGVSLHGILTQHNYASTANFGINKTGNKLAPSIGYTNGTREYDNKITNFTITNDVIFNAVLVYNSSENKIYWYINGQLDSSYTLSATPKSTNYPIGLGRWDAGYGDYYFNGRIYSGNIHNRALTATEIQQNFNANRSRYGI